MRPYENAYSAPGGGFTFTPVDWPNRKLDGYADITETDTVPGAANDYTVELTQRIVPNGTLIVTCNDEQLTIVPYGQAVGLGQAGVSYDLPLIQVNSAREGQTLSVTYTPGGGVLSAGVFNHLQRAAVAALAGGGGGTWGSIAGTLGDQSDLQAALDAKVDDSAVGAAGGVASLDGSGKVPSSQLPAIAITSISTVASQAAQLALTAQEGDVAVRSDENKSYVHNGGTAGTMADWTLLATPTDTVLSVNGMTGAVTLGYADVGAAASSHTHSAADINSGTLSTARLPTGIDAANIGGGAVSNAEFGYLDGVTSAIQTQINGKASTSHTHSAADINSGTLADARLSTNIPKLGSTNTYTGTNNFAAVTSTGITDTSTAGILLKSKSGSSGVKICERNASGLEGKQAAFVGQDTAAGSYCVVNFWQKGGSRTNRKLAQFTLFNADGDTETVNNQGISVNIGTDGIARFNSRVFGSDWGSVLEPDIRFSAGYNGTTGFYDQLTIKDDGSKGKVGVHSTSPAYGFTVLSDSVQLAKSGGTLGFYGAVPVSKPAVDLEAGSTPTILAICDALVSLGLITYSNP